jgi:Fe-Mn family superoxide dismutase
MNYVVAPLPYAYNALEPHLDEATMKLHHTKHHQAYVDKLNAALASKPDLAKVELSVLLRDLSKVPEDIRLAVQNHGGGHHNHTFFWTILSPHPRPIEGRLKELLEKTFGSIDECKKQLSACAVSRFGSGWAWLVLNSDKKLEVMSTANQDSPLMHGKVPLVGIDVWEHAYYLKYQNRRAEYVDQVFEVIDWGVVSNILEKEL